LKRVPPRIKGDQIAGARHGVRTRPAQSDQHPDTSLLVLAWRFQQDNFETQVQPIHGPRFPH
jgi:hypothetical protein